MEYIFGEDGEDIFAPSTLASQSGTPPFDASQPEVAQLPQTLGEAIEAFAKSDLMKQVLGEHIHSFLIDYKRTEWHEYLGQVTSWELDRNLAVL
jgi:glutamine synthetase